MIILGIDPGLAIVGWGVLESVGGKVRPIAYGAITTPAKTDIEARLLTIRNDLKEIINKYKPDEMAIEELFWNTNQKTGIKPITHNVRKMYFITYFYLFCSYA